MSVLTRFDKHLVRLDWFSLAGQGLLAEGFAFVALLRVVITTDPFLATGDEVREVAAGIQVNDLTRSFATLHVIVRLGVIQLNLAKKVVRRLDGDRCLAKFILLQAKWFLRCIDQTARMEVPHRE